MSDASSQPSPLPASESGTVPPGPAPLRRTFRVWAVGLTLLVIFAIVALAGGGWWAVGQWADQKSFLAEQAARSKLHKQGMIVVVDPETKHVTCISLATGHVNAAILQQLPALYRLGSFSAEDRHRRRVAQGAGADV